MAEVTERIRNKCILVADDDESMPRVLNKVLTNEGAIVTSTNRVEPAIDVLTRRPKTIDLVITDLRMPVLTGTTLVYLAHQLLPALPVIVLTAFGNPESRAQCLRQGAVDFLEKPLNSAQLFSAINNAFAALERNTALSPSHPRPIPEK